MAAKRRGFGLLLVLPLIAAVLVGGWAVLSVDGLIGGIAGCALAGLWVRRARRRSADTA